MIATVPTQAQIGRKDPAVYFRVILSDEAIQQKRLAGASKMIRERLSEALAFGIEAGFLIFCSVAKASIAALPFRA